jgi:hypothetical protein
MTIENSTARTESESTSNTDSFTRTLLTQAADPKRLNIVVCATLFGLWMGGVI